MDTATSLVNDSTVIAVLGQERHFFSAAIIQVLKKHFSIQSGTPAPDFLVGLSVNVLLLKKTGPNELPSPVLVVTKVDNELETVKKMVATLPSEGVLVVSAHDKLSHHISHPAGLKVLRIGFLEQADFFASDINITDTTVNFKLNYQGNSVPVWIQKKISQTRVMI
ncbi:MAG: hypothetical protein ACHQVK_01260 [Candidatus Paceibacterales bacterium]